MKYYLLLLIQLLFIKINAQTSNNIKIHDISFERVDSISNINKYKDSLIKQYEETYSYVIDLFENKNDKEELETNKDSIVNNKISEINSLKITNPITFKQKYSFKTISDSIILKEEEFQNLISNFLINVKNKNITNSDEYQYPYEFDRIKNLNIREYKNDTKLIHGVKTFKIICTYSRTFMNKEDFIESHMYVTQAYQSLFHPYYKVKEILIKYYPLEIIEYNSWRNGLEVKTKLLNIKYD